MKFSQFKFKHHGFHRLARGFTLVELMIAMGIFSLVVIAMVNLQIFGLKVYRLSETKLIATTGGRQLMDKIRDPIRAGNTVIVGTYGGSFSPIPSGSLQIGNALAISPLPTGSPLTNNVIYLYQDQLSSTLNMVVSNQTTTVANHITNTLCFQAEDYRGNILLNYINNPVIRVDLGFIQWINGTGGSLFDIYHLQTRISRRAK